VTGFRIEDPAACGDILREALATPGPVLVEAVVDPHEPPMPPKVTLKQTAKLAQSLASGTPNAGKIALTIASDTVREII
jgi:pyruvate dehydrogenase (quinone)/pyruvate oxidase